MLDLLYTDWYTERVGSKEWKLGDGLKEKHFHTSHLSSIASKPAICMGIKMNEEYEKVGTGYDRIHNRERILRCTLKLFYEKGYDAVGVQEIANAAGVTKPTLYYYFKSKYGLLEGLLFENCTKLNENLKQAGNYNGDLTITLERICRTYLQMAEKEKEFYYFMIALFYSARENEAYHAIKPYMIEQFHIIRDVFIRAADKLGNMRERQEQFAVGFTGIMSHYILVYYEGNSNKTLATEEAVHSIVHQFMHGIYS